MSTFHAVVWMDHQEAHVVMFDREHVEAQRIKSRSHHKHQGKAGDIAAFFTDVAHALKGTHEVLLTGPGIARNEFRDWCMAHQNHRHGHRRQHRNRSPVGRPVGLIGEAILQKI